MSYFDEISLDNPDNAELIEEQQYQDYLRKQNKIDTEEKFIERFLRNQLCVWALKKLPDLEKLKIVLNLLKLYLVEKLRLYLMKILS